ncbi:SRPBCC family protein, partial [Actinoalloteichus spitiensis]|uniref:SRPBCC family protein n=1 Tax=Actinoalloteichus spitiensis TaxID=252394 RepID=UPI00037A4C24
PGMRRRRTRLGRRWSRLGRGVRVRLDSRRNAADASMEREHGGPEGRDGVDEDSVRQEAVLAVAPPRAWELVTRPEHLRVWYAFDGAALDARVGGLIEYRWREHGRFLGVVEALEPPTLLRYRLSTLPERDPAPGRRTTVAVRLQAWNPTSTLVRVVESGLASLAVDAEERRQYRSAAAMAWAGGLELLVELAARGEA